METFKIAEKIYEDLNKKGAGLGNVSIVIIQKSIDEMVVNKTVLLPDVSSNEMVLFCGCKGGFCPDERDGRICISTMNCINKVAKL